MKRTNKAYINPAIIAFLILVTVTFSLIANELSNIQEFKFMGPHMLEDLAEQVLKSMKCVLNEEYRDYF